MTDGHYFVSYSRLDAADFTVELADLLRVGSPSYRLWVDAREIRPGQDWDEQIAEAIQGCTGVLFVMTPDSIRDTSGCKQEMAWALRYKKPIIPLRVHADAKLPFRLASRQYVDYIDRDAGLARLRLFLAETTSPAGVLRELTYRLADAEREFPRAADQAQRGRIELDMTELRRRITEQETLLQDPRTAEERTNQRIAAAVEAERQPARPEPTGPARARFVNPAPMTAPGYFEDRHTETELIGKFLQSADQRLMTVVGRGGVGKTAMVCRLLKALEGGHLPDELGELTVDGIVYLSPGAHPVSFPNLFGDLCRLLPAETADRLQQWYRDPQQTPAGVMRALLAEFPGGRTVVLLDNFEDLVDSQSGGFAITDLALDEALRSILAAPAHGLKVLITTRVAPRNLLLARPGVQQRLDLDAGLPSPHAEQVLRARDPDGKLGIRDAPLELLTVARERTRGFPRALEALAAILAADRDTSLPELLTQTASLPGNVVETLVGEAFQRLDPLARQVMQALAVFPVPVSPVAVDYLLQPHRPTVDAAPVLSRLVNMQFVRRDAGRYYLHQVDRDYALSLVPPGELADRGTDPPPFTRHGLRHRAGNYFKQVRTPREDWKTLDDLAPQLTEFELRYQNEDYDTAAAVLLAVDFDYLIRGGHYRLTMDLHRRLQGRLTDPWTTGASATNLATCHRLIGQVPEAMQLYEQALYICRDIDDRAGEASILNNLGIGYGTMGQTGRAVELYEQALTICRDLGDRQGEANGLNNLGGRYATLGQTGRAVEQCEQALTIYRDIRDRSGEATTLNNLGVGYAALGQTGRSVELCEQALTTYRDIRDRSGEANALNSLGDAFADLGQWQQAAHRQRQAIEIADVTGFRQVQAEARVSLAKTLLFADCLPEAQRTIGAAHDHPYPPQQAEAALIAGIIALRSHSPESAAAAFEEAVARSRQDLTNTPDNYAALDTNALAHAGLALINDPGHFTAATDAFHAARKITSAPGITNRILRLLDALTTPDTAQAVNQLRAAASTSASPV